MNVFSLTLTVLKTGFIQLISNIFICRFLFSFALILIVANIKISLHILVVFAALIVHTVVYFSFYLFTPISVHAVNNSLLLSSH